MDESNNKHQNERDQDPGFAPTVSGGSTTPLKRKATIGAAVALVVAGLGLGGAWVAGAFAPKPEATEAGGTLAGDDGKDVADKAADNASKAPAADKEKVVEADAVADGTARAEDKGADAEKPSTGSDSSLSKSDSKPSSGSTNKPNHEHEWQAPYRTEPVYTTETYTLVDQKAWDEQVRSGSHFLFSDGHICYDGIEAMNYQFDTGCSYSVVDDYKTIHHEAITHQETRQVETGTKQVLTGYRCPGCGAVK